MTENEIYGNANKTKNTTLKKFKIDIRNKMYG